MQIALTESATQPETTQPANNTLPELPGGVVRVQVLTESVDRSAHSVTFVRRVDISKAGDNTAYLHVLKDVTSTPHHMMVGFVPQGNDPNPRQRDTLDHYTYVNDISMQKLYAALAEVVDEEQRYLDRARSAQGLDTKPLSNHIRVPQRLATAVQKKPHQQHHQQSRSPRQQLQSSADYMRSEFRRLWGDIERIKRELLES